MKKLIIALSIFIPTLCIALPTVNGPSGLIEMPTADSVRYKEVNFGFDYNFGETTPGKSGTTYSYKFNLGSFKGWELGLIGGTVPTEGVFINAKYYLMSDNERYPTAIAVGIEKIGSKSNTSAYMVASKRFEGGFSAHFGFRANFNSQLDAAAMLGAEFMVDDRFSFLADVNGENRVYSVNIGLRYYFDPDVAFRFSIIDLGKSKNAETITSVGIAFAKFI